MIGRVCPQANPAWQLIAAQFAPAYLAGKQFNASAAEATIAEAAGTSPLTDPRTTEDCLFLDVIVPEQIFNNAGNSSNPMKGAPVLVWIYGGGYTFGEKTGNGVYNPAGLVKASQIGGSEGLIYIALNYRLGAFGWLAGPTLQSDGNVPGYSSMLMYSDIGTANAALYDQRLALQWVQKYVHLFGGDPNRVTVFGESAGGGSIMHQITAFGGVAGKAPFQQAVLQSGAFQNLPGNFQQEQTFNAFLSLLNVSTLQEARQLPSSALIQANIQQVGASAYGLFTYGPVVDGLFAPGIPGKLLLQGSFDHDLKLMLGHNADEGLVFTSPFLDNDTAYDTYIESTFPDISPSVAQYIDEELYPVPSNSTLYEDDIGRASLSISESTFVCNTLYLNRAFGNQTYAYQFSVPPALHGQDIPYTFFNGPESSRDADAFLRRLVLVTDFDACQRVLDTSGTVMDDVPPSYESAIQRDYWTIIAVYVQSSGDLCAASRRSLKRVRHRVRSLTHTLHLPPAQAEIYDGPRPEWLRDVLANLPNLQSLVVSQLPFFDHLSLVALRANGGRAPADKETQPTFALRLLIANQCTNTTQRSLSDALTAFPHLVFLDLSRTLGARDVAVLSKLRHMDSLQILKLCGIQLRDDDMAVLAQSIGTKVRSLDVRDNLLTDHTVRILRHSCFQMIGDGSSITSTHPRGLSGAEEDWPSGILKPDPAVLDEFRDESFDERYLRRLTQGLVSRLPSEDQACSGITHLYIANNRLTVEGVSSLIKSMKLHVLDAGMIDVIRHIHRSSSSISSSSPFLRDRTIDIPGAETLTPILAKYASKNLTSLRVDHNIVTKSTLFHEDKPSFETNELDSNPGCHELDAAVPAYELPSDQHEAPSLPKRGSVYAPETVGNHENAITTMEDEAPKLIAAGLNPVPPAATGVQDPKSNLLGTAGKENADPSLTSPDLSRSLIEKQRQILRSAQLSEPHGLLPSTLPQLRSLSLIDVPCYDRSGQVISALINFIRYCASESELAKLQADVDSIDSPYRSGERLQQAAAKHFALRKITLEMSSSETFASTFLQTGLPRASPAAASVFRSKSSTEDADSEALWAAQENDFSFFDDNAECGLPSVEPGSHFPMSTLSEKVILPTNNEALPTLQQPSQAGPGQDVIQQLAKFRSDRKAAYESGLEQGYKTAEGYWPGEVKVIRRRSGKTATIDYYDNYFEKGYIYR
ncbi:MAG: hypothetical protein Q9216_001651 [Gyalolechia sp. 2 TL-2023]